MAYDIYFGYALLGMVVLSIVLYGVRIAVRGAARSERVSRIGGTALLGQEVMDWTYWAVEPIVGVFVSLGSVQASRESALTSLLSNEGRN